MGSVEKIWLKSQFHLIAHMAWGSLVPLLALSFPVINKVGGLGGHMGSLGTGILEYLFKDILKSKILVRAEEWTTHFTQPGWTGYTGMLDVCDRDQGHQCPVCMGVLPWDTFASRSDKLQSQPSGCKASLAC